MSHPSYTTRFDDVRAAEHERVRRQRAARGVRAQVVTGLALSGGGIRSASFSIGVLQAMAACTVFPMIDYLSTVSGGGYAGTALTWFLQKPGAPFPFLSDEVLDRIRRQANYLSPTSRLTLGALLAAVLQKTFVSLAVYGALLVGFFFFLDVIDHALRPVQALVTVYTRVPWLDGLVLHANALLVASAACVVALVFQVVWLSIRQAADRWWGAATGRGERAYLRRRRAVEHAGIVFAMAVATLVVGTVPLAGGALATSVGHPWGGPHAVLALVVVATAGVLRARPVLVTPVLAFALLYGLFLVTHAVAMQLVYGAAPWLVWIVLGGALGVGATTSLGAHGSADVYRDRLTEAFMPDPETVASPESPPARQAASYALSSACAATTAGPYHLLNVSLVTPASRATRARGRGAHSFVLSPLYCGSHATGWRTTDTWRHDTTTLADAMAVSAAAVDPHAAAGGVGATRSPIVSMVLALLGLCLGQAVPNPRLRPAVRRRWLPANLISPGIRLVLLGNERESGTWVTLADGGDFDDLGIYELVRRRIPVIFAVDATCDPTASFAALGNVIERVRVDFGVEMTFPSLEALRAGEAPRAHVIGRIHYPACADAPAFRGMCVYLKARMLPHTPADVLAHALTHPAFPHDPTFDQCFDEGAFEAYRMLGLAAARTMLDDPTVALALASSDAPPIDGARALLR